MTTRTALVLGAAAGATLVGLAIAAARIIDDARTIVIELEPPDA